MINLFGNVYGNIGYAVLTRELARAMNRSQEVALFPLYTNQSGFSLDAEIARMVERCTTMMHDAPGVFLGLPPDYIRFSGKPRIGFVIFEGTKIDESWRFHMKQMDRLWVLSQWGKKVLIENGFEANRIDVVPGGFDPEIFKPNPDTAHWETSPFRFLTVGKFETRKGMADVIRAYAKEFQPDESVELWVHAHNPFVEKFDYATELRRLGLDKVPRLRLLAPRDNAQQMAEIYRSCHCFVTAARAEGFGLPLAEAMASGLPAIATDYGPHRELTSPQDSFMLRVERLEAARISAPGMLGEWAIPDSTHLMKSMREAFENRQKSRKMGLSAAKRMLEGWTWDHAAKKALAALRPEPAARPAVTPAAAKPAPAVESKPVAAARPSLAPAPVPALPSKPRVPSKPAPGSGPAVVAKTAIPARTPAPASPVKGKGRTRRK